MNNPNRPEPDLDDLIKGALKDDLPPEAEARMSRQFLRLKHDIDRNEQSANAWLWVRAAFRKEILAVASAAMFIMGLLMQLGTSQSALAHSIEQLKVMISISVALNRASSMDCVVLRPGTEGRQTSYRIRWRFPGDIRVDRNSPKGEQTLWVLPGAYGIGVRSSSINAPGSEWQPALEFMSAKVLARHMEEQYGLMQSSGRSDAGVNEFIITGREGREDIEISVDAKTYLPKVLKKYSQDPDRTNSARNCVLEARFIWDQPVPDGLFSPQNSKADGR